MSDTPLKWEDLRKQLYTPEELVVANALRALYRMEDGLQRIQQVLSGLHHDPETGCLDRRVIEVLAETYQLQSCLAEAVAEAEKWEPDPRRIYEEARDMPVKDSWQLLKASGTKEERSFWAYINKMNLQQGQRSCKRSLFKRT